MQHLRIQLIVGGGPFQLTRTAILLKTEAPGRHSRRQQAIMSERANTPLGNFLALTRPDQHTRLCVLFAS